MRLLAFFSTLSLSAALLTLAGCTGDTDVHLDPPAAGTGFQLGTPKFVVPSGMEIQDCYYMQVPPTPHGEPSWAIHQFEVAMNKGSHHMNLFRATDTWAAANVPAMNDPTVAHPCFTPLPLDPANLSLILNNQTEVTDTSTGAATDWTLPDHVALDLRPGEWLVLQTHFVNATTQTTPVAGHVLINFHAMPVDASTQHMCAMFANNRSIMLPAHAEYSATTTCAFPPSAACAMSHHACTTATAATDCPMSGDTCVTNPDAHDVHIVGLAGHFHSRGTRFTIRQWDGHSSVPGMGTQLYESTSWNHAPFGEWSTEASAPLMHPGEGFDYTCEFFNDTDTPMVFGPHVETQEHCNLFAYFYPCFPAGVVYCF